MSLLLSLVLCVVLLWPAVAAAQIPALATPSDAPGADAPTTPSTGPGVDLFKKAASWQWEQVSRNHIRYTGQAEIESDTTKFFADQVDIYTDTSRLEATGNVVFAGQEGRISAERVEYNLQDGTGAIEERARYELGMVREGEVFVQFVAPAPKVSATPPLPPPANSVAGRGGH